MKNELDQGAFVENRICSILVEIKKVGFDSV